MKLAIMQPYFLPYIGYFQLMKAADEFVFYDDVTYIKQGWISRNRILLDDKDFLFTLELKGASSFKEINAIEVGNNRNKLLKTFLHSYKKAPFFNDVEPLLYRIFESTQNNLSQYIFDTNEIINNYLGIKTELLISSSIAKNNELKGQDKVIEICNKLGAKTYINSIGGKELYSKTDFANAGMELFFLQSKKTEYKQFTDNFVPWLSIIDVMMFNNPDKIQEMLDNFEML
jgi:hypothetical protein